MTITIRKATKEDHPTLLTFEQGIVAAERPFDKNLKEGLIHYYDLLELISSENAEVFVAEYKNELIGSGFVKIEKEKSFRKHDYYAYIGFMFVKENFRGKGISKMILDSLLSWAKSKNISEVLLEVYDGNQAAIRAYKKAGFKERLVEMSLSI